VVQHWRDDSEQNINWPNIGFDGIFFNYLGCLEVAISSSLSEPRLDFLQTPRMRNVALCKCERCGSARRAHSMGNAEIFIRWNLSLKPLAIGAPHQHVDPPT
jgi:hypothetical protein